MSFGEAPEPRSFRERFRKGWAVPLEMGPEGRFLDQRPQPLISTARLILEVGPGERRLLPEFGCRIHWLPGLSTEGERQLGAALVEEALDRWAPYLGVDRAEIRSVEDGMVLVALRANGEWHELSLTHRPELRRGELRGTQAKAPWKARDLNDGLSRRDDGPSLSRWGEARGL